jgi:hypothetical protein
MNALATLKMIIDLLPLVIQTIKAVEDAIPGTGKGEAKLTMVRGVLESVDLGTASIWPAIEKVIAAIVATFNKIGEFKAPPSA